MEIEELTEQVRQLKELQRQQKELDTQVEAAKNQIKGALTARGVTELQAGVYKIMWTTVTSHHLDAKALRQALPEVAERFSQERVQQRLTIT